ncbi:MAG: hypothetical protein V1732_02530, partial [Patescibacteria group bacterium]
MSFHPKIKNKLIAILFAIIPAFVVGSLVLGANVYYDLDSGTVKTYEQSEFISSSVVDLNKAVNISQTGATTAGSGTDYGLYVANTGAGTINVGGYFSASGATNNYGLIVENGNVGIGTTAPTQKLDIEKGHIRLGQVVAPSAPTVA